MADSSYRDCMEDLFQNGADSLTMGEARELCTKQQKKQNNQLAQAPVGEETNDKGVMKERLAIDETNILKPFTLMSHRKNYILLAAHNFKGWDTQRFETAYDFEDLESDNTEVQFQLSIKTPLAVDLLDNQLDIFAGYTVTSYWQCYNTDISSPFRETNHEPEVWLQYRPESFQILGFTNTVSGFGLNHMSNGQAGTLSRSWNRIFGVFALERGNLALSISPWIRITEDEEEDDNPDITDFYGHGELWLGYSLGEHTFTMMTRNNLESGFSKGAIKLGWSFPLFRYPFLKGYIQYFSGYGESLIDYDRYVNRIGIGIQLTDLL